MPFKMKLANHFNITFIRAKASILLVISLVLISILVSCNGFKPLKSKPNSAEKNNIPKVIGTPPVSNPLPAISLIPNPYLLDGRNGLHYDLYNSDVTNDVGPMGKTQKMVSHRLKSVGKSIPTMLFDSKGRIITSMISFSGTELLLMDPVTLEILAKEKLPRKSNIKILKTKENDAAGGSYLHFTPNEEVIVPRMDKVIAYYKIDDSGKKPVFILVKEFNLSNRLPKKAYLNDAVPDYNGQIWFTTSTGIVGYIDKENGEMKTHSFPEHLQNQMAVDTSGVYVLTHEYLNKLTIDSTGEIQVLWRTKYDNSADLNGLVSSGSGTSPTLFGTNNDLIAIADNGSPRLHLNVYHRKNGRLICSIPVFSTDNTGCENSPIGYGNDIVVEDNGGFKLFFSDPQTTNNGLIKIHVRDDLSGGDIVWENYELKASTTPVLSTANGMIYSYCVKEGPKGTDDWYMSLVDWQTGKTVYQIWVGSGKNFSDMLQPVVINDGTFYIGTKTGVLVIRDTD